MKKQELIHMHGLLAQVAQFCEEDLDPDLERYYEMETRPTSINQSKNNHIEAVVTLSKSITEALNYHDVASGDSFPSAVQTSRS